MRLARRFAMLAMAAVLLAGCSSAPAADAPIKKPANVATGPETLLPAPQGVVEDTPQWTELPKPVAAAFGSGLVKGKFQAFAAMKEITVQVQLKNAPQDREVFKALDAALAYTPEQYSILLNVYAPGADGKDRFTGYEWAPVKGTVVKKGSADEKQGWDDAITAITLGVATGLDAAGMKQAAAGGALPLFK